MTTFLFAFVSPILKKNMSIMCKLGGYFIFCDSETKYQQFNPMSMENLNCLFE